MIYPPSHRGCPPLWDGDYLPQGYLISASLNGVHWYLERMKSRVSSNIKNEKGI